MLRLAEKSGLSVAMISYVERGARKPTLDTLLRIANLDVDLWRLIRPRIDRALTNDHAAGPNESYH
jgi:transcriptional regulator with XRE-family HTH domain